MAKALKIALLALLCVCAALLLYINFGALRELDEAAAITPTPEPTATPEPTPEPPVWLSGFAASDGTALELLDENFEPFTTVARGTALEIEQGGEINGHGVPVLYEHIRLADGTEGYLAADAIAKTHEACVREPMVYVHTTTSYYLSPDGIELDTSRLAEKGAALTVLGCDTIREDGRVRMYHVADEAGAEGYIRAEYVTKDEAEATAVADEALQALHADRGDPYGGGDPGALDYRAREKDFTANTAMPETCKTLYIPSDPECIEGYQNYLDAAANSGINAFCVDIIDGSAVAYPSDVMAQFSPSSYNAARNARETYAETIAALKAAGYYVIGRITCFNDPRCYDDNIAWGITNPDGSPKQADSSYFLSPFSREAWQYKLATALEAVEWFGFDEIQFDYIRCPSGISESANSTAVDFKNHFSESKAQAIQRFLMYAADNLHEAGVWLSADVFGETANAYVAQYGQYWPAISNVVDVISAMPYPDHYGPIGDWNPWEHPYELIYQYFAAGAVERQTECPTPARVRTWIQCYDAIKPPYNRYYSENVGAQIRGLFDAGLTGGYMTWNGGGDWARYDACRDAFNIDP